MALRDQPWRSILAIAFTIAVAFTGHVAIDEYHELSDYIAPTILSAIGLAFAWRATRSQVRWDRLLGYPTFGVLALLVLFMIIDRTR
jgi:hypothetical protein